MKLLCSGCKQKHHTKKRGRKAEMKTDLCSQINDYKAEAAWCIILPFSYVQCFTVSNIRSSPHNKSLQTTHCSLKALLVKAPTYSGRLDSSSDLTRRSQSIFIHSQLRFSNIKKLSGIFVEDSLKMQCSKFDVN